MPGIRYVSRTVSAFSRRYSTQNRRSTTALGMTTKGEAHSDLDLEITPLDNILSTEQFPPRGRGNQHHTADMETAWRRG